MQNLGGDSRLNEKWTQLNETLLIIAQTRLNSMQNAVKIMAIIAIPWRGVPNSIKTPII